MSLGDELRPRIARRNAWEFQGIEGRRKDGPTPMTLAAAQLLVNVLGAYAAAGAAFAVLFLWRWIGRFDPAAAHATWGFRVLVFPGIVIFWPLFASRLIRARTRARVEVLR